MRNSQLDFAGICNDKGPLLTRISVQGCAPRKIEGSPVLRTCKIKGAQHMICTKNLRFSSCPGAKVGRQGPPGSAHLPFLSSNCKILKVFLKTYPTKGKATKCPVREKKSEARKTKNKREGEKAKRISQDCCVTFKPKNYLEILLSANARTSQASILHLAQKAVKCTTCKQLCDKF